MLVEKEVIYAGTCKRDKIKYTGDYYRGVREP